MKNQMRDLAKEIVSDLSGLEPNYSKELLGTFVTELFLSIAEQDRREDRRQRQAEGITAAKARGVRFGRPTPPLPDNFDQAHQAWRGGKITLRQAADACGMPKSTFYNAVMRREHTTSS